MTFNNRKVLGLVPARGGSKAVVRKNLRLLNNRPLLAYTIDAALGARAIDEVFVSSDDDEILSLARSMNATALRRPAAAATDIASASDVVASFVRSLSPEDIKSNPYVAYLQPTSPRRTAAHIDAAFHKLSPDESAAVMSVVLMKHTPFKSFKLDSEGRLVPLFGEGITSANRQDLPPIYYPNGAIYIFSLSEYLSRGVFPTSGSIPFVMTEYESLDIDTEDDLRLAEKV